MPQVRPWLHEVAYVEDSPQRPMQMILARGCPYICRDSRDGLPQAARVEVQPNPSAAADNRSAVG